LIFAMELAMHPTRYEFSCVAYVRPSTFFSLPLKGGMKAV